MKRYTFASVAPVAVALLVGCGSSSSTTATAPSTNAAAQSYATTTQASQSPAASSTSAVVISTKKSKVGTILAIGPKKMTVYLFEGDKNGTSSCSGACASVWPPVTVTPHAGGTAATGDLGTITRSDGKTQVTYKGHPLYLFAKDGDAGDAYGQGVHGFGADWYVVAPSGAKVDNS